MNLAVSRWNVRKLGRARLLTVLFAVSGLGLLAPVITRLFQFSQKEGSQHYSHFILIPLIAGYFVFASRRDIRPTGSRGAILGVSLLILSALSYVLGNLQVLDLSLNDHLAFMTTALVLYIIGAFIWVFGMNAFRIALFPLLFLVFLIPIPEFLLHAVVVALQTASADVVDLLFAVTGSVYLRDGFTFSLPGLNIQVAEQCSGIRSTLSLFIVSILAGHMGLRTTWGKVALALAVFPITVFKNGVRIVLLSLLAIHWDPAVMRGTLHTTGGIPFFVVAMALLGIVFLGICKLERRLVRQSESDVPEAAPASVSGAQR